MVAHKGITTGLFAEYSYDYRRTVLLNPPVLFVRECMCGWVGGVSVGVEGVNV